MFFMKQKKAFALFLLGAAISINNSVLAQEIHCNPVFDVGAGIYDITGPAAEEGMMGYAMIAQQTAGIYQRLWSRAFVIESPLNHKRVAIVSADLGMIFQGIKEQVVAKLKEKFGDRYDDDNVLITATHTHSGPGGFSTYRLYNLTTLGFSKKNFDTIVDGIVASIERAQNNMTRGRIKIASGKLKGISFNRSPASYLLNNANDVARYAENVDVRMTLLRFEDLTSNPIGMINWFPLHGVSMNNKNHLITGDNKGHAAYLFEQDYHSDYGPTAFVAAFAQANAGDVSPNEYGKEGVAGLEGLLAIEKAAKPQYQTAKKLFKHASEFVMGDVDYRHTFIKMDEVVIDPRFTDGTIQTTCPAAIGVSMLAGTQDGEGLGRQGVTCDTVSSVIPHLACELSRTTCQGVKPIALQMGVMKPHPWTPNILPLQIVKIGNVVIVAAPFELTTMSGRRIRETVARALPHDQPYHVIIAALSNAYSGYVTTNEEYQLQRYEGASTHFGPWTLAALQQGFLTLTEALVSGKPVEKGPTPPDLLSEQYTMQPDVVFDDKPINKQFGDVDQDVNPSYKPGDTVKVSFWGGHPKNNYRNQGSYLAVQRLENGEWQTIRRDRDWDTEYHWQRSGLAYSLITIVWRIPQTIAPGIYRIQHDGDWKNLWNKHITPYTGTSAIFTIS